MWRAAGATSPTLSNSQTSGVDGTRTVSPRPQRPTERYSMLTGENCSNPFIVWMCFTGLGTGYSDPTGSASMESQISKALQFGCLAITSICEKAVNRQKALGTRLFLALGEVMNGNYA